MYPFSDGIFKMLIYLIEIEKFFAIEDRTPPEERELSDKAEMLRIFRDVLEEKEIPEEKLKKLLDKDFVKDVSLEEYSDETLLNEVDGMTNILYEKQGSYLQGQEDMVKAMLAEGVSVDIVMRVSKFSEKKSSSCRPRSLGKKQPLKGEPLEPRYDYRCDDCRE